MMEVWTLGFEAIVKSPGPHKYPRLAAGLIGGFCSWGLHNYGSGAVIRESQISPYLRHVYPKVDKLSTWK